MEFEIEFCLFVCLVSIFFSFNYLIWIGFWKQGKTERKTSTLLECSSLLQILLEICYDFAN